jgi:hypothetical protein
LMVRIDAEGREGQGSDSSRIGYTL